VVLSFGFITMAHRYAQRTDMQNPAKSQRATLQSRRLVTIIALIEKQLMS
jgi:hypothetical protein